MTKATFILVVMLVFPVFSFNVGGTQEQSAVPRDTLIILKRFANAFGGGANYKLTISSNGEVTFKRFANPSLATSDPRSQPLGPIHTNIPVEKVVELVAEFERIKYFSLKDTYARTEDGCPGVWSDQGGAEISITINGKTKFIEHYHGCAREGLGKPYPEDLTSLEDKIDEVVGTERWLK